MESVAKLPRSEPRHSIFNAYLQPRDTYGRDFQDQRRLRDNNPVYARWRQNQKHPLYGRMQRELEGHREALRRYERRRYRGKALGQHLRREADFVRRPARPRRARERSVISIFFLSTIFQQPVLFQPACFRIPNFCIFVLKSQSYCTPPQIYLYWILDFDNPRDSRHRPLVRTCIRDEAH